MEIQIFKVYFITFSVEVVEGRKRENQGTKARNIGFDGQGIYSIGM